MVQSNDDQRLTGRAFTLLELLVSLALVAVLMSVLVPLLTSARVTSQRDGCAGHLRQLGRGIEAHLTANGGQFPVDPMSTGWRYAGFRFSTVDRHAFADSSRPMTDELADVREGPDHDHMLCCPADTGIRNEDGSLVTREASAFRTYGTSYRANYHLFQGRESDTGRVAWQCDEIITAPSRLVVLGDPIWFEVRESTGRDAAWHGDAQRGNLLFLDGSVRFMDLLPKERVGPAVFEPRSR